MNRITVIGLSIFALLVCGCVSSDSALRSKEEAEGFPALAPFKKGERVLILAPHPDDEAIGCAGIIQEAVSAGAQVKVAYLTNGEHNQFAFIVFEKRIPLKQGEFIHLGQVRQEEAIEAMKLLGVPRANLIFMGYPDFGTFAIFSRYWQSPRQYRSFLTRISSVPYKKEASYGREYAGENILIDLKKILLDYRPQKIFVSHPADVNVDHKALYLFLQVALADLYRDIPKPKVYPYLVHCLGWPLPRHYHPELYLAPPDKFLASCINWKKFDLDEERLENKHRAILCYKSQTQSSAFYLLSFARRNEIFGDYPVVNLETELERMAVRMKLLPRRAASEDKAAAAYRSTDNCLWVCITKPGRLTRFSARIYLFGYSSATPFAQMPKLCLIVAGNRLRAFEKSRRLQNSGIALRFSQEGFLLRVPLEALGYPDFILASVRSTAEPLPEDIAAFRKIVLK
jgi:LmbE family N-acetylglucosaminyl deacetylase